MTTAKEQNLAGISLPYDSAVEYIESTGTQYIYIPGGYGEWIHDIQFTSNSVNKRNLMGYTAGIYWGTTATANPIFAVGNPTINVSTLNRNIVKFSYTIIDDFNVKAELTVDGMTRYFPKEQDFDLSTYGVFCIEVYHAATLPCYAKLFSLKFNGSNGVKYNLIPVRKDNHGYLYDKISGQMFGNNGKDEFILGPDVKGQK